MTVTKSSSKNVHKQFMKAIERLKQLVEQHYKEPLNGQRGLHKRDAT